MSLPKSTEIGSVPPSLAKRGPTLADTFGAVSRLWPECLANLVRYWHVLRESLDMSEPILVEPDSALLYTSETHLSKAHQVWSRNHFPISVDIVLDSARHETHLTFLTGDAVHSGVHPHDI